MFFLVFQAMYAHVHILKQKEYKLLQKQSLLLLEALQDNQRNHLGGPDVDVQTANETISWKAANQIEIYHMTIL